MSARSQTLVLCKSSQRSQPWAGSPAPCSSAFGHWSLVSAVVPEAWMVLIWATGPRIFFEGAQHSSRHRGEPGPPGWCCLFMFQRVVSILKHGLTAI